jgi:hypothetical protein
MRESKEELEEKKGEEKKNRDLVVKEIASTANFLVSLLHQRNILFPSSF